MMISHRKKFIFIHNYKVAGTSIRNCLRPYSNHTFRSSSHADKLMILLGMYPKIYASQFIGHIKAAELKKDLPKEIFNHYFKFGFVRNPWDWQVSLYTFMLTRENHHQHDLVKSMSGFDEYIDWRVHEDLHLQKDFFFDGDDCLMDFIGKMENLQSDFNSICQRLKVDVQLEHKNKSREGQHFLEFYSEKSLEMVNQAYATDIRLFDYEKPMLETVRNQVNTN